MSCSTTFLKDFWRTCKSKSHWSDSTSSPRQCKKTKFHMCLQIIFESQGDENSYQLSWNAKTSLFCCLCLIDRWIHIELGLLKASAEFSCLIKLSPKSKATAAEVFLLLLLPSHNKYNWGDHKCFGGRVQCIEMMLSKLDYGIFASWQ